MNSISDIGAAYLRASQHVGSAACELMNTELPTVGLLRADMHALLACARELKEAAMALLSIQPLAMETPRSLRLVSDLVRREELLKQDNDE